ncbi:hypothetical protein C8F01DRAFT_1229630 [Mycena amicta]|nr:hypothetical protein C8F01DRAFT_1229630 [Mycena amicta]
MRKPPRVFFPIGKIFTRLPSDSASSLQSSQGVTQRNRLLLLSAIFLLALDVDAQNAIRTGPWLGDVDSSCSSSPCDTLSALTELCPVLVTPHLPAVRSQNTPTNSTSLPLGSCTADIPCSNHACCNGKSGFCGFGSDFCGSDVCTSNCDAQAECGKDAPPENVTCPLNVCCSQFGFCGTTSTLCVGRGTSTNHDILAEFCGDGCQSHCGAPATPSCGTNQESALNKRIGYYEGWANGRSCMSYPPEKISAESLTHINFAFALISSSFQVVEMTKGDSDLWKRTTALKSRNPTLKVFLSIGGWTFNDPPTSNIFSNLAASSSNTNTFTSSLLKVFETYGFDGVDIDWEYPAAYDRGGNPADTKNYVTFMAALKKAFGGKYGLTFTAPSSFWYLQHFDLPGLLKSADWVNVMTYDLHGTWDGTDIWIGPIVEAHTNLTEINAAFELYWRVGVDPSQMVMGLGFYGRSFTLASPDCPDPGCIWASGADAGPCSGQSGILMYNEIQSILKSNDSNGQPPEPTLDEDAAVKYVVWNTNQWVSYDDADTFAIKMSYAEDRCIGGTMVWSVDQDDDSYSALNGLYPGLNASAAGETEKNDKCFITECDVTSCGDGYIVMTETSEDPLSPGERCGRLVCCPKNNAPSSCFWRGMDTNPCNPTCHAGEQVVTTETCSSGGASAFCCTADFKIQDYCTLEDCQDPSSASCPSGSQLFTTIRKGELDFDQVDFCQDVNKNCPPTCSHNDVKPYCCVDGMPFSNCKWYGTPPLCHDNACPLGQISLTTDIQGDASKPCSKSGTRSYCCDYDGKDENVVGFSDIFPDTVPEGSLSFQEEFDPDSGVGMNSDGTGTSSQLPNDGVEDDTAFGEVFIDSPNSNSVSSLELSTNWVITGCSQTSDQPQSVAMYCKGELSSSECSHVFIGGAEHTIVKLPTTCGRGPYARVDSLAIHPNQDVLSSFHQSQKPTTEPVYLLRFDYNFAVIPEANGPIYMRADVTDMPDYWDTVVESPPERKRWLKERGLDTRLEQRWWGSFKNWLNKLNTVEKDTSVSRNFHWQDTWTIFHKEVSCPGPPTFEASIDVSLSGQANLNSRYGFYLQATIVPPAVQAAYVYFSADASAHAQFTLKGEASLRYDSSMIQFAKFGFPGLYYPGLLTIGPSLVLQGYIAGELSVSGQFTTSLGYTFPTISFNFGKTDPDVVSPAITPASFTNGINLAAGYNVELTGDLSIHAVPALQLGLSVLGGAIIDAQAFVQVDLYAGVMINGSVSNDVALKVCVGAYYGVSVDGGLTGNVLYWETGPLSINFYENKQTVYSKCFDSVTEEDLNSRSEFGREIELVEGTVVLLDRTPPSPLGPAYIEEKRASESEVRHILPRADPQQLEKRLSIPFIPGLLNCPETNNQIGADGTDDDPYSDGASVPAVRMWAQGFSFPLVNQNQLEDAFERRRSFAVTDDLDLGFDEPDDAAVNHTFTGPGNVLVKVSACPSVSFKALPYNMLATLYYDLQNPTDARFDPTFGPHNGPSPMSKSTTYGREHIYELQLISDFMTSLATQTALWQGVNNNFCSWLNQYVINQGMVQNTLHCFPYNARIITQTSQNPFMPWLEGVANGIKANAIHGNSLSNADTWKKYAFSKMISVMRSTAGLASYMNDPSVRESFITQSNCMKTEWNTWYTSYSQQTGVTVTGGITSIYTNFIRGVMSQFSSRLQSGVDDMITIYNNQLAKATGTPMVSVNWGTLVPSTTATQQASQVDLTPIQNFVLNNGVTWWNRL